MRIITTSFAGQGITAREGEIWIIEGGVPAPPALLQNSVEYDGRIPFNAVRSDQVGHDSYASAYRVRTEPKPAPLLTEADLLRQGWSKAQLTAARAAGFPAPTGRRDFYDDDGVPSGSEGLWHPEIVRQWIARVRALPVGGR